MSTALGVLVSAALALGPAPARLPQRFEDLEALVSDLAAQKSYQALADTAERGFERRDLEPSQRRLMAFFAIRGLHGVYEGEGKVANLCRARRLLRRVERDPGLADDASTAARLAKVTAKLLVAGGGEKQCSKTTPGTRPALASRSPATSIEPVVSPPPKPTPATENTAVTPEPARPGEPGTAKPAAAPPPPAQDDLVAVGGRPLGHVPSDMFKRTTGEHARVEGPARPVRDTSLAVPSQREDDRALTARTRGGIASLSVAAAAGAALGASLYYRGQATERIVGLASVAEARGESTAAEYAEAHRLNQSHQRLTVAAWATGTVALVGLVTGVTLLVVKHRRTTTAAAPWASPTGAGLTLRGHF
ncbi:hypothetical protein [Nannocystis radixulma]|uniref:Uncharacterized protein n=1 Tax=Nannocystis radixulma TaxID=2995305 RepID=A0ABT5B5L3_9BACT|nr:hypothetical protein [Nannocystis radixulma]MDC0668392.1 hypothetical protein [Nannocystis radixulma]